MRIVMMLSAEPSDVLGRVVHSIAVSMVPINDAASAVRLTADFAGLPIRVKPQCSPSASYIRVGYLAHFLTT
jgi:hypothetical protein